ncbi:hypothetical protein PV328_002473 [Microctonus aethiopoides]|uniref:Pyruvate kinase n=1 Tax=Microctonus aethiopoides TaxID=144406 RepID=A0AA39KJG8_9HYME|nr:hypothetical protein PV328_002473 [Microctonus aethiopoides]
MMKLEDQIVPDRQLGVAYQDTRIDHEIKLNVNCNPSPARLTEIMITLGETNNKVVDIVNLFGNNHVDMIRLNASHGDSPEIRTGIYKNDSSDRVVAGATFLEGDDVKLLADKQAYGDDGSNGFWTSCRELPRLSRIGDRIILDRGGVCLKVNQKGKEFVNCTIMKSDVVGNGKIVQPIDTALNLPQISKQDNNDIDLALELESKISTCQGVEAFDDILKVADGIVIDRESLQVEVRMEKLFLAQKSIIAKCNRVGKPVVVTYRVASDGQMKFELDLVANAVLEGADCIFLATGSLDTKETLRLIENVDVSRSRMCTMATTNFQRYKLQASTQDITDDYPDIASIPLDPTHAMAIAAVELSMKLNASAIIVTTTTGQSAMLLSALIDHVVLSLQLSHVMGLLHVGPLNPDWNKDIEARIRRGMNYLRQSRFVDVGDAIVTMGSWHRGDGFTNSIRVLYFSSSPISNNITDFEETW